MSMPMPPPKRKNPALRTRPMHPPPAARSRIGLGLTAAAARGELALQVCQACGAHQYPPRESCNRCPSTELRWQRQDGAGKLLAITTLAHSNDLFFRERLPWRLGMVALDVGVSVLVHLHEDVQNPMQPVRVLARLDRAGQAVLIAAPQTPSPHWQETPMMREMGCDPKHRKILITDGKTPTGQALVRACVAAGAQTIWVGYAEPWKKLPGLDDLAQLPGVSLIPLDLTNERDVAKVSGGIGGKVDIVINNAEAHRTHGIADRAGTDAARFEMDLNYFGLLRLAQSLGPALKGRAADGPANAVAWVNVLSIYALANFPAHGTYSASKAAAYSLAQCLRAEMRPFGIRVINVFPGPIEDEWFQSLPPPKLNPDVLARAMIKALQEGTEDVYPGDVAQEWLQRWREDPKILEREIAAGDGR